MLVKETETFEASKLNPSELASTHINVTGEGGIIQQRGVAPDHSLGPLCVVGFWPARYDIVLTSPQATDSLKEGHLALLSIDQLNAI